MLGQVFPSENRSCRCPGLVFEVYRPQLPDKVFDLPTHHKQVTFGEPFLHELAAIFVEQGGPEPAGSNDTQGN